jgi:hypothetical protein
MKYPTSKKGFFLVSFTCEDDMGNDDLNDEISNIQKGGFLVSFTCEYDKGIDDLNE